MDDKFSNVGVESMLTKCPHYSRIGHQAVKMGDEVLILGGTGPFGQFVKPILRLNLQNFKMEVISNVICPCLQGFSSFTHKDTLYLWGGIYENKPCNTLWSFKGSNFQVCAQNGQIPSPRTFHESVFIANRYLLVYGGFNEMETFNDWHIFDVQTFTWNRVQSNIQLSKNVKFRLVWGQGRGYMVSQFQITRQKIKACAELKNNIFQIRITNFSNYKMRIDQLQYIQGEIPISRGNFSLIFIQGLLWMMGGQIINQNQSTLCNDVWTFDIETMVWSKRPFLISVKTNFEIVPYKNKLFLIGGIKSVVQMSGNLEIISFRNINLIQTKICNFCKSVFSMEDKNYLQKQNYAFQIEVKDPTQVLTQISTNFLTKMAHFLQNPIQAIGLLVQNSLNMSSSLIYIKICTPNLSPNYFKQDIPFLYIGDNSKSFSEEEITRIIFSFRFKIQKYYSDHLDKEDVKMRNQYGLNLKLASLRLGNSCLFVTSTIDEQIFVAYFSDIETDCPDGDPSFNCFHYSINKDGICSNPINKHIIKQNVKHLIDERQYLNNSVHNTKTFVFGLHDIVKSEGRNNRMDIIYSYSQGFPLFSLTEYLSTLYLNPLLGRQLYIQQTRLSFTNPANKFKEDERNGLIQEVDTSLQESIFSKICLYRVLTPTYSTNFVYIYHQNRLIYAISSRQKIICGYIQVPQLIEIDLFKSKIQRWQQQRKLIGYIQSKEQPRKRQRKLQNYAQQTQVRKVRPSFLQF